MDSTFMQLPSPPQWSLVLGVAGRALIIAAIVLFLLSAAAWMLSPKKMALKRVGAWAFTGGCVSLFGTFAVLAVLFGRNRLEYAYVWSHGEESNTLPYRIAGIWSGQEGSFLLWACCAALFGLLAVRGTGEFRRWFTVVYSVFLGSIAGILAYETPFRLNMLSGRPIVPESGVGLSPALQNYWVTIHPPTIFLGFGALTVLAAYAFAAMATGRVHEWAPMVRPWSILSLTLVGVGLCMGGFWAYETLGWGGFWMWDPVENVSFVPWVFNAAFTHGIMVQIVKRRWTMSNLLMGGLPFLLFVYGTFLTRSGALSETSVHSFAQMDTVAHKLLLGFLGGSVLGFFGLWFYRLVKFKESEPSAPERGLHREGFYRTGAMLLALLGIATLIGMSVPLFMAIAGKAPQVVEEQLYHRVLAWIYIPLMLAMAAGPMVAWHGMGARKFVNRIYGVLCVTLLLAGLAMVAVAISPWARGIDSSASVQLPWGPKVKAIPWVLILVTLSIAVVVSNAWRISELFKRSKLSAASFVTHVGVAVLLAGLIVSRGLERKTQVMFQEGSHNGALGYLITFKGKTSDLKDKKNKMIFELQNERETWTARPGFYYVTGQDGKLNPMVWPHIERRPLYDLYFTLHPIVTDASDVVVLRPGESAEMGPMHATFEKMTRSGEPGQQGALFGAQVKLEAKGSNMHVNPALELTEQGMTDHPARIGNDLLLSMKGMDVSSGAVSLQLHYTKPYYPIELFYKPMTILVWGGTGIMTVGGLLAAFYRRRAVVPVKARTEPEKEPLRKGRLSPSPAPARATAKE